MSCLYKTLRPLLFQIDPERAHELAIMGLRWGTLPRLKPPEDPVLQTRVCGMNFPHPIGLAAGFDKQARAIKGVLGLGFGFVELGTIVPKPQTGNPKPRLFRIPESDAIINRFGFNSDGQEAVLPRVAAYFNGRPHCKAPVGINISKNKDSAESADDYIQGVTAFAPYADYLAVNVSSPNTPGLRALQNRGALKEILSAILAARATASRQPPIFLKIAPDQTDENLQDIADLCLALRIDGIIVGNTTVSRLSTLPPALAKETGGLSGRPLFDLSTRVLADMYRLTKGKIPLIGCGGVFTGADAYAKIRAGASLVQIYTAMIYEGPYVAIRIAQDLAALLKRDGFASVAEAIGK